MQDPHEGKIGELNRLRQQGKLDEVVAKAEALVRQHPHSAATWYILGEAFLDLGKGDAAKAAFQNAILIDPKNADAHVNLGVIQLAQGRLDEAIASFEKTIALKPESVEAQYNLGLAYQEQKSPVEAIAAYQRTLELMPDLTRAEVRLMRQRRLICDWGNSAEQERRIAQLGVRQAGPTPFAMLAMEDHPERQLIRSQVYAKENFLTSTSRFVRPRERPTTLRIGYFSGDFHDHAVMFLISGLFREHDRSRFNLSAYSFGQTRTGALRKSIEQEFSTFNDVAGMTGRELNALARRHKLDIAIDLSGYTQRARTSVFAQRVAPIQINYLGYPGTIGGSFMDYIVGDPTLIPETHRSHYSENVIYLPHTYQPNDNRRVISNIATSRRDFGLPEKGFVFCCFNQCYKITPREFDIWMRLLTKVEDSVLWLSGPDRFTKENLRREATARGVGSNRLVFARQLPPDVHLSRHRHADLFVDTFNYNAHTTASDALWSGLPVVTMVGEQFAARVAASLLNAAGLPELIAASEKEYESLIFELATSPEKLNAIRSKLEETKSSIPLFDTARYARDFERGLNRAYDLFLEGRSPEDIRVGET